MLVSLALTSSLLQVYWLKGIAQIYLFMACQRSVWAQIWALCVRVQHWKQQPSAHSELSRHHIQAMGVHTSFRTSPAALRLHAAS
jgi:hypothetical protein